MSLKVYINGEFFDKENAKISVFDHGFLYGDGVFEGIRSYSGKIFRHREHIDRLYDSAAAIALTIPMTKEDLMAAVEETLKINGLSDAYIRLVVSRGMGDLGLDPNKCEKPSIIIITDAISLYPQELYENGLDIVTASTIRVSPAALSPRIKSLNYLNNILAKIEGDRAGCKEALMLNHKGEVAECTGDNVFIIRREEIFTPSIEAGVLEGITRNAVIELARNAGYTVHEMPLTRFDVYIADECFLTGTAAEIIPVVTIDSRKIGTGRPGPFTKELIAKFHTITGK
ncbi:MAG: branched-chain-amino-acid transaminase [Planctomycetaceae bacterium]|jgi:branched-chain amino acid aminotransferase|nr:branched-chain-amino-acid transaminase [Planctomycetaceae bacterium]